MLRYYAPTIDDGVELHRSYYHRKRRQGTVRHTHDPKRAKRWSVKRRQARAKRML